MSAGEVGWRTGIQPWRFRLNSFPAKRLQARPTAAFRTSIPAQVLGGLAWRSQLAESAGGVACRTAPAGATPRIGAGDVWWRCLVAVFVGGVCWRCLLAVSVGGVAWRCRLAVSLGGVAWRCRLAVSAGGVGWRSQLAESVGGPPQLGPPPRVEPPRTCPLRRDRETIVPNSPLPVGGVGWRSRLAVSTGGVSWRSQLAESVGGPGYSQGDSALTHFLRTACRRGRPPFSNFHPGSGAWRPGLAESAGGVGWRCRLPVSVGGVRWRSRLSDRTSWGHPPDWSRRGTVRSSGTEKRSCPTRPSQLAEWVGRAAWRSQLAESVGGVGWRTSVGPIPSSIRPHGLKRCFLGR